MKTIKPLLEIQFITYIKGYFQDGTIRRKYDKDWIFHAKIKPEINLAEYIEIARERDKFPMPGKECRFTYRKKMISYFPSLNKRVIVNEALKLLGDDVDGAWSCLEDYGINCDLEELIELNDLKAAASFEYQNELKVKNINKLT